MTDINLIISALGVTIAIIGLAVEIHRARISLQTEAMLKLDSSFNSSEIIKTRQAAARKIMAGRADNRELEDVFDFFTTVTILLERGALDRNLVYDMFSYWMVYYWIAGRDVIKYARQRDTETWLCLERAVKRMLKIQKIDLSEQGIHDFLIEEARKTLKSKK
jgi:hypothetical protein